MVETVAAAVEIVDDALADLADAGCDPLDRAAALLAAGLAELAESDDLGGVLAVYRLFLEHTVGALRDLQAGTDGSSGALH
jgi:hypothetical protein